MDESERKRRSAANAVGGSTARACDGCLLRRARWYCGADDAFLCQACDSSVHTANSLARRHQRLRLHAASSSSRSPTLSTLVQDPNDPACPGPFSWHKRKARTPRPPRPYQQLAKKQSASKPEPLVPDLDKEEDELEMDLLCRVPDLDPLFTDFCSPIEPNLLPPLTEMDMMEYGLENLDVDCLLGVGLDDVKESSLYNMDGFTIMEEDDANQIKMELDVSAMGGYQLASLAAEDELLEGDCGGALKKMGLRLDYDAVIKAWSRSSGCSPWAGGSDRPQLDSEGTCLPAAIMGMPEGEGDEIQGEAEDEAVRQEDTLRGEEAQRGEASEDEGPVRETVYFVDSFRAGLPVPIMIIAGNGVGFAALAGRCC